MPRIARRMLIAAGLVMLGLFVVLSLQIDDWSRDLTTNQAATSKDASDPLLRSIEIRATHDQVTKAIVDFANASKSWSLGREQESTQDNNQEIHLVRRSRIFGFADDVTVFLQPSSVDENIQVDASSQSRLGKGDLGQNPRNLRQLMQVLRSEFELASSTSEQ